ncbi:jg1821, partial [Pararge aegeria aegeria]
MYTSDLWHFLIILIEVCLAFPSSHVSCSVWQASRTAGKMAFESTLRENEGSQNSPLAVLAPDDVAARCKTYALALLRGDHTPAQLQVLKRGIIGTGAGTLRLWEVLNRTNGSVSKLDSWLEPDNYTNILHKGLERLVAKFQGLVRSSMQPDEFVSLFFNVANQLEDERRSFAISRLRDTETLKQSPTDTITQYAYNLMSHQTKLAQKCLDDRAGRRHSSAAICKYGTSTQECSCLFSKVFRLPCRHILMLTTELK